MTTTDDRVREIVRAAAEDAPSVGALRTWFDQQESNEPSSNARRGGVWLLAAAAVAVLVLGVAWAPWTDGWRTGSNNPANNPNTANPTESTIVTPSSEDKVAVETFVQDTRTQFGGGRVAPAALWEQGRLVLAFSDPVPASAQDLDGQTVGGLRVDVVTAKYSQAEYEAIILRVSEADSPANDDVAAFNLPAGSQYVEVQITGLSEKSPAEIQVLKDQLTELADGADIRLVESTLPPMWDETFSKPGGTSPSTE